MGVGDHKHGYLRENVRLGGGKAEASRISWVGCRRRQSRLEGKIMSSGFQLPRCLQAALLRNGVYNMTMPIIWLPA